jgi:tetratricopeptide (TPR) repeat protein
VKRFISGFFQTATAQGDNSPATNIYGDGTVLTFGETTVDAERRHGEQMAAMLALREDIARKKGVDTKVLLPLFENLGQSGLTLDEMRGRAGEAIEEILARARRKVEPSNDGADIAATIGAARAKLGQLDTDSARSILAAKIAEEEAARRQRLIPLLEEQAAVEQLSYDHEAAKATLRQLRRLDPDNVWNWIGLGDLEVTTGALDPALDAFRRGLGRAECLAKADPSNADWQRDLSVSQDRIGDVQREQGNLLAALTSYRASLAIAERLAKADPGNAGWQRDLSVSQDRIGDVQREQGNLLAALMSYRASLAIAERLAKINPGNAGWQRDLALSYANLALVKAQQGTRNDALGAFQQGQEIVALLLQQSPDNATLHNDLAWFDGQIAVQG